MIKNAFFTQLEESTKEEICSAISHLHSLSDEKRDERHYHMLQGAEAVLYILQRDPIAATGTQNWLKQMDRDQLEFTINEAKRQLKTKSTLGKVTLYGVYFGNSLTRWFKNQDDAKAYYMSCANDAVNHALTRTRSELTMYAEEVPMEELHNYELE